VQQRFRHGAAAVGIAGPKPSRFGCADGKTAGRAGELAGTAGDFPGILQLQGDHAVVRVDREGGDVPASADEVHGAAGEDQIIPADVGRVGGRDARQQMIRPTLRTL